MPTDARTSSGLLRWVATRRGDAIRSMRDAVTALRALERAVAMNGRVLLAAPRSFCAGVDRAIEIVERLLEQHGAPVYVRHQIVHNEHVVRRLEGLGAVFVEDESEIPEGEILRALRARRRTVRQGERGKAAACASSTRPARS